MGAGACGVFFLRDLCGSNWHWHISFSAIVVHTVVSVVEHTVPF